MTVRLTRIYTKTGDAGQTHLGDMSRVAKTDPRLVAYTDVDETNSVLGVALALGSPPEDLTALLRACLVALAVPGGQEAFRPAAPAPWGIRDALARVRRLLGERPDGAAFARLLPPIAPGAPDRDLRCRTAVASTLSAGLEMARAGEAELHQDEAFGDIRLRAASNVEAVEA